MTVVASSKGESNVVVVNYETTNEDEQVRALVFVLFCLARGH